jgi:multidrug efflux pump subunit AcrA (membrane-fusion protein)
MSLAKQLLLCLALVAAGMAGWYVYANPHIVGLARENPEGSAGVGEAGSGARIPGLIGSGGAVNVVTTPVVMDEAGETVMALGTARAARSVTLFPQGTGFVTEILFRAGDRVEAGAPLVRLEDDEEQVALERARVALEQATAVLERSQALAE